MSSDLKVTNIKHESSSSNNLVLGSDGNVSITNQITSGTFNGTIGDSVAMTQGTWTPTFTNDNGTDLGTSYGDRYATYTRIGNLVFFNVEITLSSYSNSSSNQLYLSGLPMFGVSPSVTNIRNNGYPGGIVSYFSGVSSSFGASYSIHWVLQNNGRINFYYANGSTSTNFVQAWLTSSSRFIFDGKYYLAEIT